MKLFQTIRLLGTVALLNFPASAAELRDEWIDADTGHRVVRLSRVPGQSQSLYFHQNGFTASGDKVVFENTMRDTFSSRIYAYDFPTQKSELVAENGGKVVLVAAKSRQVYHQRSNTLYATHLDTRTTRTLTQLPSRWRVASINADETLGAGSFLEEGGPPLAPRGARASLEEIFEAARPGGIFLVNLKTGETNMIRRGTNWFNHFQFSPTDPALLQYCHEGPWHKLDRIWHIRVPVVGQASRLPLSSRASRPEETATGTAAETKAGGTPAPLASPRLIHQRTMPMEIAGHEFWSPDGQTVWFDLQMPRGEKFFLAGVEVAGGKTTRYPIPRDQWSVHYNISWDGRLFAGDGGAPNMVARAKDGKWLYLFTPQADGTLKAEKLVNMAKHDYGLEPNVQFTPDGKRIVFRANFDGLAQVYAVDVAKAERN